MLVADDFFDYFSALSFLLYEDPTVFAISAYNDNGKEHLVMDPSKYYDYDYDYDYDYHHQMQYSSLINSIVLALRSDHFTGGAWMITLNEWNRISTSWPTMFWLEWIRESYLFEDRVCIHPEVSRVITFGENGINPSP